MQKKEKRKSQKRKKPPVQTKVTHTFVFDDNGQKYGNRIVSQEERKAIIYPLNPYEYEGKGLPEETNRKPDCSLYTYNFDIRMAHSEQDSIELGFALNNTTRHSIKPYDNLPGKKSCYAKGDFERSLYRVIKNTCFILADACVKKQTADIEERKKFLCDITDYFYLSYKEVLGLGERKIIEEFINADGMKVEKSIFTDIGRRKGTNKPRKLSEKELENRKDQKAKIFDALRKAKNAENKSEIAKIIGISRPTFQRWLKSIGIHNKRDFFALIRLVENVK